MSPKEDQLSEGVDGCRVFMDAVSSLGGRITGLGLETLKTRLTGGLVREHEAAADMFGLSPEDRVTSLLAICLSDPEFAEKGPIAIRRLMDRVKVLEGENSTLESENKRLEAEVARLGEIDVEKRALEKRVAELERLLKAATEKSPKKVALVEEAKRLRAEVGRLQALADGLVKELAQERGKSEAASDMVAIVRSAKERMDSLVAGFVAGASEVGSMLAGAEDAKGRCTILTFADIVSALEECRRISDELDMGLLGGSEEVGDASRQLVSLIMEINNGDGPKTPTKELYDRVSGVLAVFRMFKRIQDREVVAHATASKVPDYYQVLGVSPTATPEEIKKAFRKMARVLHPDCGGNNAWFDELKTAYNVLGDPEQRAEYNKQRMSVN